MLHLFSLKDPLIWSCDYICFAMICDLKLWKATKGDVHCDFLGQITVLGWNLRVQPQVYVWCRKIHRNLMFTSQDLRTMVANGFQKFDPTFSISSNMFHKQSLPADKSLQTSTLTFPFLMTQATQQQRAEKLQWNNTELHVKLRRFDSCRISIFRGGGSGSSRLQKTICTFSFQITGGADLLKSLAVFGNCHKSADVVWRYQSKVNKF